MLFALIPCPGVSGRISEPAQKQDAPVVFSRIRKRNGWSARNTTAGKWTDLRVMTMALAGAARHTVRPVLRSSLEKHRNGDHAGPRLCFALHGFAACTPAESTLPPENPSAASTTQRRYLHFGCRFRSAYAQPSGVRGRSGQSIFKLACILTIPA